ncbi:hypothetical protein HUB97_12725 [Halorubraceae archaeon YAN]|nr:hypothetical protein [Halorubraceae archaeon YAN]
MGFPVRYYCPHCETIVELERDGYLADKAVTPYPFAGWEYATPSESIEDGDGVVFHCGEDGTAIDGDGCGERFYLSFVRFENGVEIDPRKPSEHVQIGNDTTPPSPRGPDGFSGGGFW